MWRFGYCSSKVSVLGPGLGLEPQFLGPVLGLQP